MEFKVGDRVIVNGEIDGKDFKNEKGTIINISFDIFGIKFDRNIGGHDICGKVESGYGYNVHKHNLTKENRNTL